MDRWRTNIRRGPVRALIAVCLLAGVFAMHGLTGNHDAAMMLGHQPPATAAAAPSLASPLPPAHSAHPIGAHHQAGDIDAAHRLPPSAKPSPELASGADHHGHIHVMTDLCLAMLAALLLALVVALARRSLTVAHPVHLPSTPVRPSPAGPSPPWRRPTLSKLCILRT